MATQKKMTLPPPPQGVPQITLYDEDDDSGNGKSNQLGAVAVTALGAPQQVQQGTAKPILSQDVINTIVLNGDLSKLTDTQLTQYYIYRCRSIGLDPATKPFDILTLQGKKILYANKSAATQLRDLRKITTQIIEEREWNGLILFKVRATAQDGRVHEDEGFARVEGLSGDALGNARLKSLTKATRRAILNLCGLGEMDETEVDTIPNAKTSAFTEAKQLLAQPQPAAPAAAQQLFSTDTIAIEKFDSDNEVIDKNGEVWTLANTGVREAILTAGLGTTLLVSYVQGPSGKVIHYAQA